MEILDKNRKCIKCGGLASAKYVDKPIAIDPWTTMIRRLTVAHMLRTCHCCGYKWKEIPLDKSADEKPIDKEEPVSHISQEQQKLNEAVWELHRNLLALSRAFSTDIKEAKRQQELQDMIAKVQKEHASWWETWRRHFCG